MPEKPGPADVVAAFEALQKAAKEMNVNPDLTHENLVQLFTAFVNKTALLSTENAQLKQTLKLYL